MLKNFFKTAARNILKNKAYSLINFVGLTAGLSLALLIVTYVRNELNYDRFQKKADRLYRLSYTVPNGLQLASTPPPIAPFLKEFFPEVEEAARLYNRNVSISRSDDSEGESFEENRVYFADSSIMKMFSFEFISGNKERALKEPFTILINEEMAKKYFGNKDPLGESLVFGGKESFKVGGVVKDFPETSHIRFNMLVPYDNMFDMENDEAAKRMRQNLETNFVISHGYTYVLLKPGYNSANIDQHMLDFLKKYAPADRIIGQKFTLMPVPDIHLKSTLLVEPTATNSMTTIYIFIAIGILTLLIAAINYINLSTAQSFTRIKEIGVRKILGSAKSQLITQFLSESFLFCLVATVLSYGVFYTTLPILNQLTDKHLLFGTSVDFVLLTSSLALLILLTVLAGGYPAYFVASFNSISAIKGSGNKVSGSQLLRKSLVVFQLMIACMLLSGSMMLIKQLNFLTNQPLGFQREHIINIPLNSQNLNAIFSRADSTKRSRLQTFRDRIESQSGVNKTTATSATPGLGAVYRGAIPEGFTREDNLFIADVSVDYDFIETYGMELIAGRSFSKEFGTDEKEAFIINETAVKEFRFGTPEQALGKTMDREGKKGKIVGVIRDYNISSLTTPLSSVIMEIDPNQWSSLSVKFDNDNVNVIIESIKTEWNRLFPEKSFQFTFLDEQLNQQYSNYQNFAKIIQAFTLIAIIISCLGVYGLVLFVVQRKVKEIGVRKVVGASMVNILRLIYSDFVWLLLIGFILAVPVSYIFISKWLENFIFRTSIDVLTYVISFLTVLMIVAATISYHAVKAAMANPVKSLRTE